MEGTVDIPLEHPCDEKLDQANNKLEEFRFNLNQTTSQLQISSEENKQLKSKIEELKKNIEQLEAEKIQFLNNQTQWVKQYNTTMELFYQNAFNLLNVYNSRRLQPVEDDPPSSNM